MAEAPIDNSHSPPEPTENQPSFSAIAEIQEALHGLRFGHVTVVVHEGAIVQIERLEKRRLRPVPA